jgi:hypothetical protein
MSGPDDKDFLGLKAVGKAAEIIAAGIDREAHAFLERIGYPVAKELGLLFKDQVKAWRTANALRIVTKAKEKLAAAVGDAEVKAAPRLVGEILETGSWIEDSAVQELWAGLLSSSCTNDGKDDSNLIFINLLSQITGSEAKILKYLCELSHKQFYPDGRVGLEYMECDPESYLRVGEYGADDADEIFHRLDFEFHHLNSLELVEGGPGQSKMLMVTQLTLSFYVRCMGSRKSPFEYFRPAANTESVDEPHS